MRSIFSLPWHNGLQSKPIHSIHRGLWHYLTQSRPNTRASSTDATSAVQESSLRYPTPPSSEHHDIATYEAYAARTGLDVTSTVYVGTHYEYTVAATLRKFGFDLRRIGGRDDAGIDLLGTWTVPSSKQPLRAIVQCKATGSTTLVRPQNIRELEGTFIGAPPSWRGAGVIAFLATRKPATKGIREALQRSRWPLGFITCSPDGKVLQMLWNGRAEEQGLLGMGVGVRYSEDDNKDQYLVLTYKGNRAPQSELSTQATELLERSPSES